MTPIGSTADIDYVMKDAGVPVTIGAISGYGLLRRERVASISEFAGGLEIIGRRYELHVRNGAFALITQDALVVAGGANYRIENTGVVGPDGIRVLILVEAAP